MTLELNEHERDLLLDLLKSEHVSLHDEVHYTDGYEYKQLLKKRLEVLIGLKSRVESSVASKVTA